LFTCTKFRTAPDLIRNIIKTNNYQLLTYNVDTKRGIDEEQAFLTLGEQLNQPAESVKSAYLLAKAKENELIDQHATQQNALLNLPTNKMKILIVGHDYNVFDAFVGKPIVDFLQKSDCICIYAEYLNPSETKAQAKQHSPTLRWDDSQRLFGACIQAKDKVDGIILVTAFPCGPDSMVNEMLFRKIKNIPIIQLICDEQEGTAGRETRLESFIDIIRFKKGVLNNV
jgi:predicted nucleotide-binding protein (sugar kinase/HSP70/actin superfamily)